MATECTYQFSCPSCSALLQAVLKQALTSVQCGECFDVFDVQMPQLYAPHPWTRERKQPYPEAPCGQRARPHAFIFLPRPAWRLRRPDARFETLRALSAIFISPSTLLCTPFWAFFLACCGLFSDTLSALSRLSSLAARAASRR